MRSAAGALFACALLTACASGSNPSGEASHAFARLPGWSREDHRAALEVFRATCGLSREPASRVVCARARAIPSVGSDLARRFFEANFRPEAETIDGLLTAYFTPVYDARSAPDAEFSAPVRAPDPQGMLVHASRAEIEAAPAPDALAWMRPEDLFFVQIQGSGVLRLADGSLQKALYVADNGKPYVAIGRVLAAQGRMRPDEIDAASIHRWLAERRGDTARAVMQANPRYIFFALAPDTGQPPRGAAAVPLVPGRSVAVDPLHHAYGELLWLAPSRRRPSDPELRSRVVVALDTGSAIKGPGRADIYLGRDETAGAVAARVRHRLRLVRLVPRPAADASGA